jgi:uncharacterized protein (TIGR02246 family)
MRNVWLFPVTLLVGFMSLACQVSAQQQAPIRSADQVRADADRMVAIWVEHANARDAAGVASIYTGDVVFIDPYGNIIRGRAAIQQYWAESFAGRSSNWESRIDETVILGDVGVSIGTASADIQGTRVEYKWLSVSVQEPDGVARTRFQIGMVPAPIPEG